MWRRRLAELQRKLRVGYVHRAIVRWAFEPSVRQLRDAEPDLQQRDMVGLDDLRERGRLRAERSSSVWRRRLAELQRKLRVGYVHRAIVRWAFEPSVRQLRDAEPDLQQRGMVGLDDLRERGRLRARSDTGVRGRRPELQRELPVVHVPPGAERPHTHRGDVVPLAHHRGGQ
jgi:hypothetical protein